MTEEIRESVIDLQLAVSPAMYLGVTQSHYERVAVVAVIDFVIQVG